ncbi:glycoside hydrolase family 16 protein [Winogradskyella tangerina]|uniref:glycoside hydrolase family 16 protein n=1 Tax=Winogradskyella tangerina TaxID=2023240 RepID=UPI000DBE2EC2|nr:glycoside hydrolase family 16 protein [Winogradskyella tangerina]
MHYRSSFVIENILALFLIIGLTGCKQNEKSLSTDTSEVITKDWTLIFEDNFDKGLEQWNIWKSGAFNNEIQFYQPEQVTLNNGILEINIKREAARGVTNPINNALKDFEYVSGRIESKTLFGPSDAEGEREYRFMARLKLPPGHGMWPAFWTYGDPWPTTGEIDILEARGGEPEDYSSNLFFGREPSININSNTEIKHHIGKDLTKEFHIYEMIWRENSIDLLFDGELLHSYQSAPNNNINNMFGKKQKVVLNTAVGGWFISDRNSKNYVDSSVMEVDWVKVYKK